MPNPDTPTARVLSRIPGWEDMSDMRLIGLLCEMVEAGAEDTRRLDYLECEPRIESLLLAHSDRTYMPRSLFRRNLPITRAAINAALAGEVEK